MLAENNFVFFFRLLHANYCLTPIFFLRSTFADNWLDMNYFSPLEKSRYIFHSVGQTCNECLIGLQNSR